MPPQNEIDRFLTKAREEGFLTPETAEECRQTAEVLREVDTKMSIAKIAVKKGFLTEKQAIRVQRALASRTVGRYEIIERLGAGGMAQVFRARDTTSKTVVAIKLLGEDVPKDGPTYQRFMREARLTCKLDHPNLVRGIEFGEAAGYTFLAMEFVPGDDLDTHLKREPRMDEKDAFGLARKVVAAMEALQEYDLVHRDIKPANVMISAEGGVKLCDMGLTRAPLREAEELGVEEAALGTAVYVAPEQVTRPDNIDWRADVYSLGATLYHALTGRPPFAADTPEKIARMHQDTPPRDPREYVLELSAGAATVVLKMLHKDPAKRYGTLKQLEEDLQALEEGKTPVHTLRMAPVEKKPPTKKARKKAAVLERAHAHAHGESAKKKLPVGGLIAAVLAVAALGVGGFMMMGKGDESGGDGPGPVAQGDPPTDTEATETPEAPGTEPETAGGETTPEAPEGGTPATEDPEPEPLLDAWDDGSDAAIALKNVISFLKEHPEDLAGVRGKLQFVMKRYAGTKAHAKADEYLSVVEEQRGAAAGKEFLARSEKAAAHEADGRLREAWLLYHEFPEEHVETESAQRAESEKDRLESAAAEAVTAAAADAKAALATKRWDDARAALEVAKAAEVPSTRTAVVNLAREVSNGIVGNELARSREEPTYRELAGRALRLAAGGDLAAAKGLVAKTSDSLDRFLADATRLTADLELVSRVPDAARRAWTAQGGRTVDLRVPGQKDGRISGKVSGVQDGKLVIVPPRGRKTAFALQDVAAVSVLDLAASALGDTPEDRLAAVLYAAGRGEPALAHARAELMGGEGESERAATRYATWIGDWLDEHVESALSAAEQSRTHGKLPEARATLEEAVNVAPASATAVMALGRVLLESGEADEAVAVLSRYVARGDGPADPRVVLGAALIAAGDPERARTQLQTFTGLVAPDHPLREEAKRSLADVTRSLNAAEAVKLEKDGRKLYRRRKYVDAATAYERALELAPGQALVMYELGDCYLKAKQAFPAFKWLTRFTREHPDHKKVKDAKKGLTALGSYRVNDSDRETARKGDAALREGKLEEAEQFYRDALVWSPFLADARLGLAKALRKRHEKSGTREDLVAAINALDDLLVIKPDHLDATLDRGRLSMKLGRAEPALADATAVIAKDKANVDAMLLAGRAAFALDRLDIAKGHFDAAHKERPNASALFGLALIKERKRYADALELIRQCRDGFDLSEEFASKLTKASRRIRSHQQ